MFYIQGQCPKKNEFGLKVNGFINQLWGYKKDKNKPIQ